MHAKYYALVCTSFFSLMCFKARADYASAAAQVDAQKEASRQAQEQINRQSYEILLAKDNSRFANCHGGFASFDSSGYAFSTKDGWECEYSGSSLGCANVELGQKFRAFNWPWRPGQVHITLGDNGALFRCFTNNR